MVDGFPPLPASPPQVEARLVVVQVRGKQKIPDRTDRHDRRPVFLGPLEVTGVFVEEKPTFQLLGNPKFFKVTHQEPRKIGLLFEPSGGTLKIHSFTLADFRSSYGVSISWETSPQDPSNPLLTFILAVHPSEYVSPMAVELVGDLFENFPDPSPNLGPLSRKTLRVLREVSRKEFLP